MNIAIYGREFTSNTLPFVQNIFDELKGYDAELFIFEKFESFIKDKVSYPKQNNTFSHYHEINGKIDVMLSLGGDGTMLDTVSLIRDSNIPVIGINLGRLGFLASISKDNISTAIKSLMDKDYTIDSRSLLTVETDTPIFGEENFALNDLIIHRRDNSAMMSIRAYLNGEFLNTYWADGLIVATPTGSTAYSLSCGGPIVFPESKNFVITPISPHNLNVRPVVISDSYTLTFELEGRSSKFLLSCDSRTQVIDYSMKFRVSKADFQINLIRLKNESYLSTLRNKMLWGIDRRNY